MATLQVGDRAPDFDLVASGGAPLRLADLAGKKNVVLYFYPGDFTPVCTKETCGFRDMYAELQGKDTEVIGVSTDSDDSHERFKAKHDVPFPLVSDAERKLAEAYGATSLIRNLFGKVKRVTYVIDKTGKIAGVFEGELSAGKHLEGVRGLLAKLA